jgi:hypothetical protein
MRSGFNDRGRDIFFEFPFKTRTQQHSRMESNKTMLVPSPLQFSYIVFINDREGEDSSALLPTLRKEDIYRAGVAATAQLRSARRILNYILWIRHSLVAF